ncbi:hypothetical protein MSLAZ_2297 [Methanosarcina lacustris Z-7289]|uniref:Uncharacterized protein n=1 Tax=Methanosarcina lacustris Z-7289 TaxID=1434111 RepID=A0A0E3S8U1_9EURY|nr:hypothetical protein [Methanosarcina lacustris]AKB75558.1 hypothetical protein MSLAZ_2297 [Methanosarcina lacustris Z-7289]
MDQIIITKTVKKFSDLIERNKDSRAYSDFKEGINEGLEIAKDTFEENVDKYMTSASGADPAAKIQSLQDRFNLMIDTMTVKEKPHYSQDHLDGIHEGFERSKKIFGECVKEYYSP